MEVKSSVRYTGGGAEHPLLSRSYRGRLVCSERPSLFAGRRRRGGVSLV